MSAPRRGCARCGDAGWVTLSAEGAGGATRVTEASCPDCCGPSSADVLDWRFANHWMAQARPCRYCTAPTHLRDAHGCPTHKVCAEAAAGSVTTPAEAPAATGGAR